MQKADVEKKRQDIDEIKKTILNSADYQEEQEKALKEHIRKKEEMSLPIRDFSRNRRMFPGKSQTWIKRFTV